MSILVSITTNVAGTQTYMAMHCIKSLRSITITHEVVELLSCRMFSAGGKAKKGSKRGGAGDTLKASTLSKEVKSTTVVAGNILKDGADPKILVHPEYPKWLKQLLDKHSGLSELRRKNTESLTYEDLRRFVKLDNRSRIKENNSFKVKN